MDLQLRRLMDPIGKLEMCALDELEVVEIVRNAWCGTGPFTADAKVRLMIAGSRDRVADAEGSHRGHL